MSYGADRLEQDGAVSDCPSETPWLTLGEAGMDGD